VTVLSNITPRIFTLIVNGMFAAFGVGEEVDSPKFEFTDMHVPSYTLDHLI
jgi:hypothetical protein